MVKIVIVSGNKRKIEQLLNLLKPDFKIAVLNAEYPEIQHDDPCQISKAAAKVLAQKLKKSVLVEDSGLFIPALKGFPGTWTKYSHKTIGNEGILKLMKRVKNRKAYYKSALGVCTPGKQPLCFLGVEEGTVATRVRGNKGWGQDPIFLPKGKNETYGQLGCSEGYYPYREKAVKKLKAFFKKQPFD